MLLAVGCALLVTAPAEAYRLKGAAWPRRIVTYHDASPYHADVDAAVRAWNASGANISFIAASESKASVLITARRLVGVAGFGTLGYVPKNRVSLGFETFPPLRARGAHVWLATSFFSRRNNENYDLQRISRARVVAHELGHVLGLDHETRYCATMAPGESRQCPKPLHLWQTRCHLLEADDIKGAVKRYGGRVKPQGPTFCDLFAALAPPTQLTAQADPTTGEVSLRFHDTTDKHFRAVGLVRQRGTCAAQAPALADAEIVDGKPGATSSLTDRFPAGSGGQVYCYALWSYDIFNRPGSRPATISVQIPAPPATPAQPAPADDPAPVLSPPDDPAPPCDPEAEFPCY